MFKNLSLGAKLGLGFGMVVLIALMIGAVAVLNMKSVENTTTIIVKENIPSVALLSSLEANVMNCLFEMRGFIYTHDEKQLEKAKNFLDSAKKEVTDSISHASKSSRMAGLKDGSEKTQSALIEYEKLLDETVGQIRLQDQILKDIIPIGDKLNANMDELFKQVNEKNIAISKNLAGSKASDLTDIAAEIRGIYDAQFLVNSGRKEIWQSLKTNNLDLMDKAKASFRDVTKKLQEVKAIETNGDNLKRIEAVTECCQDYIKNLDALDAAMNKVNGLNKVRGEAVKKVMEYTDASAAASMDDTTKGSVKASAALAMSSIVIITGVIIGVIIAIVLATIITIGITGPINKIVVSLDSGAEQTAAASGQVSSAAQQLSQGATEQASSLEETSSSLDEMSSMTKQNADNAGKANQLAQESRTSAEEGNQAMLEMQKAMGAINESADKISKIIKTIEEIAFQTNLLALNAAVEAARAGEHGKGFAVVAEEVRNLAKRSATSAKDTAELIEDSINKAKKGSEIATKAGTSLNEIMASAKKVADIISEIAAASKEQAEGIGQITNAVSQLDQVTQQNASAAEESASASEELSSQAEALKGMVIDLQQVVAGASSAKAVIARGPAIGTERRIPIAHKAESLKTIAHNKANVKTDKKSGPKVTRPEEVIPLDDNEKTAFKEF